LPTPTKCALEPIFQSNTLIHNVNNHGKMITAPTTMSAGAMKR